MAGVVTPSMWLFVLEDAASGRRTFCSLNEGLGKVLRYGAYGPEVLTRLRWMSDVLGPLLQTAVRAVRDQQGPVDVTGILTQMLQMGDEAHNRNRAGTLMLLRDLSPAMVTSGRDTADVAESLRFIGGNDHFFLNLAMPACKLALDAARGIEGSTMVVAMARNGTDFGIQTAGTGDEWFTGPAQLADGLFLGDYGPDDANPDIGDSAITETAGIGGFAMATAPAIVRFVGGSVPDALATTRRMHEITLGENPRWSVPVLEFQGTADRHRRDQGLPDRHPARRSTPAWPASSPASARSAPAWSPHQPRSSRRRSGRCARAGNCGNPTAECLAHRGCQAECRSPATSRTSRSAAAELSATCEPRPRESARLRLLTTAHSTQPQPRWNSNRPRFVAAANGELPQTADGSVSNSAGWGRSG